MIPPSFIHDLLARTDIVALIGRRVELKKAGINQQGLCPFHAEKTPSFTVSPSRQTYHCFGCGAHGNAIGFLIEHEGLAFVEAVHALAAEIGMAVPDDASSPEQRSREQAARERQATLADVLERAAAHYREQLKNSARAVDYLKSRGLSGAIAARFGLGYAPDRWRGLASVFPRYDDPLLHESGLVIVHAEDGSDPHRYDRFRDRIMFPIRSVRGNVIGFGGRVLDAGEPKYLNSPETPVFVKGRELYGLFEARRAVRERAFAIVVEGYMDVVALAQHGFANAVATLGTSCTPEHVAKLFRFTDSVVFSFDGDAAGRRAAARALQAALPHAGDQRNVRFLFLPPEHDPDSFVRERGADAFEQSLSGAVPLSKQLIEFAREGQDLSHAEGRAATLAAARPLWSALPSGMLKRQLLGELAALGGLDASELARTWGVEVSLPQRAASRWHRPRTVRQAARQPQDNAAWLLLVESRWWDTVAAPDQELLCGLPDWHGELFRLLDRVLAEHGPLPWAALRERLALEPWAGPALALVPHDPAIEPFAEDLQSAIAQLRAAATQTQARRTLGWI